MGLKGLTDAGSWTKAVVLTSPTQADAEHNVVPLMALRNSSPCLWQSTQLIQFDAQPVYAAEAYQLVEVC